MAFLDDLLSGRLFAGAGDTSAADLPAQGASEMVAYPGGMPPMATAPMVSAPASQDTQGASVLQRLLMGAGMDQGTSQGFNTALGAIGQSLLVGDGRHPFAALPYFLRQGQQDNEKAGQQRALRTILKQANPNLTDAQLDAMAASPEIAKLGLDQIKLASQGAAAQSADSFLGDLFSGSGASAGGGGRTASSSGGSTPAFAGGGKPMAMPTGNAADIQSKFTDTLKAGGLTNPYGLAAMTAYAGHESRFSPDNIVGTWSDPSESGQAGTSGGILSWRGSRLANMQRMTAGTDDPVAAQAKFALVENPDLTMALNKATSAEEANSLMANAWRFAGYNRPGGENAARLASTQAYVQRLAGGAGMPNTPQGVDPTQGAPTQVAAAQAPDAMPTDNRPAWQYPVGAEQGAFGQPGGPAAGRQGNVMVADATGKIVPVPATQATSGASPADVPAPGAQAAEFYIPGTDPAVRYNGQTYTGTTAKAYSDKGLGDPVPSPPVKVSQFILNDPAKAQQVLPAIIRQLGNPALAPDAPQRKQLEWARDRAFDTLKPSNRVRELMEQGYTPGTPEYLKAYNDSYLNKPATGFRGTPNGNQEIIPGSSADPDVIARQSAARQQQPQDKLTSEARQRASIAEQYGLVKGTPAYQSFVLTGKVPGEDKPELSVSDRNAIRQADDAVAANQNVIDALGQAKQISPKAYSGFQAANRGALTGQFGNDAGQATIELDNLVTGSALGQLKSVFGAAPTEGERKILLDIAGSSNLPDAARQKIYDRAIGLAQKRLEMNRERAAGIRGGTYYQPGGDAGGGQAPAFQGQGGAPRPTGGGVPSAAASYLKANPQFRDQFDAKYGAGASDRVLGSQ